jgi:hypothetical protein
MKKALLTALAAAALSTAWPAAAQCVGYLIPKDARLWKEGDGDDLLPGERADTVAAVARRAFNPGLGVKLRKGLHLNWLGGCRPEDSEHDKKTKRVLLVLLDSQKEEFEEAWAMPADLTTFKYDHPGNDQDGPENVAAIRKAADLALAEIRAKDFKRPEIEDQRLFKASFDATWRALVEALSVKRWQVERIDKVSGLVTAKPADDKGGSTMSCATKYDGKGSVFANVFAKKVDGGVRVTVNTTFVVTSDRKVIACYSNGTLEREFLDEMARNLAASGRSK